MNITGLVSISFRKNSPEEIVSAVDQAGLDAIEWGGDVHCPHGDIGKAAAVKACSGSLLLPEYGSYYTIGQADAVPFENVLASAKVLGTPAIRVWGGKKSSDALYTDDYKALVDDAVRICQMAGETLVCLECHPHTVTDEYHTAVRFLKDVAMPNLRLFFQPNQFRDVKYNLDAIDATLPWVTSVHVYSWDREKKFPLRDGQAAWHQYLNLLKQKGGLAYMLEFMHDDTIESLKETAATLKEWLV